MTDSTNGTTKACWTTCSSRRRMSGPKRLLVFLVWTLHLWASHGQVRRESPYIDLCTSLRCQTCLAWMALQFADAIHLYPKVWLCMTAQNVLLLLLVLLLHVNSMHQIGLSGQSLPAPWSIHAHDMCWHASLPCLLAGERPC